MSDRRSAAIRRSANYSCRGSNGHKQKEFQTNSISNSKRETSLFTKLKIEWAHRTGNDPQPSSGIKSFWSERVRKFYMGMCLLLALFLLKRSLYFIRRLARNEKRVYREFCNDFYLSMNYFVLQLQWEPLRRVGCIRTLFDYTRGQVYP